MMVNKTSAGLFPLQQMTTLKRKNSDTSSDEASVTANERYSAFTPCRPTKRRRTSSSSSTCSSEGEENQVVPWLHGVMNFFSDTIHECKIRVSKVYPWPLGFSMQSKALMQIPDPVTGTFSLVVLCQRLNSGADIDIDDLCDREEYRVVGGSIKPKTIKTGMNYFRKDPLYQILLIFESITT